jgi:lambda family phage portal protein
MGLFDWLKREKKQEKRAYQGAAYSRLNNDWVTSGASADSEIITALKPLRNRSRDLVRNNDYAKNGLRTIVGNVVGQGIKLQSQIKKQRGQAYDDRLNALVEELWLEWCDAEYCHTAGKLNFPDLERLIMSSIIESGEVLIRIVRKSFGGSPVPVALEVIEADQLCDDWSVGQGPVGRIRMGVEVDEWQRPIAYWLYPNHPGDYQFSASYAGGQLMRLPANEILHLFVCDRPNQSRGVPWFHTALTRLKNLHGYEESELVAARAQAAVMGFIQTPDAELLSQGVENGNRLYNLEPGAIEVLAPGETFAGFAPTRPNQGFDPFVRMMLRGVAASLGLSYESLSRDYSNTSYSSARTSLIEERDNYRLLQGWLISNLHKKIFKIWLESAVYAGALPFPNYELNPKFYHRDKWTPRGWQWVDPQNEVAANKEAIKAGFTSISQVIAQTGGDLEDILKERQRELEMAKNLELAFDTTIPVGGMGEEEQPVEPAEGLTPTRALVTRAKNCKAGISCGGSCISKNKTCKSDIPASAKPAKQKLAKAVGKSKTSTKKPKAAKPLEVVKKAGTIAEIDPTTILVDPKRFQYKILGQHTQSGTVGSLSGVKRYDPNLAGILQVWEDPEDGNTYVVNGHNRLDLAKKLGAEKVAVRFLDVADDAEARAVGAITNIAEGRGDPLDAAKFFRDTGLTREDLNKRGIPMREAIAQDGLALSQLEDSLFRKTIDGDLTINQGTIIGGSGLSHTKQLALYELSEKESKKRHVSDAFLKELADTVASSDEAGSFETDLFGNISFNNGSAIEKANLQAQIKKRLAREKRLFGMVAKSKAATELQKAGNLINQQTSKEISKEAAATLQIFDQLKNLSGGINTALNEGADRILKGESAKKIEDELYDRIKKLVEVEVVGAFGKKEDRSYRFYLEEDI